MAILFYGGWDGHEPKRCAELFGDALEAAGFEVGRFDSLGILDDAETLKAADLIVPIWTMGKLESAQEKNLSAAVREGSGLGGFHGGIGDAFRGAIDYEWMVGGHFVGHPHVGPYRVKVTRPESEIVSGLPAVFDYESEQYYMMMDPGVEVLATTTYRYEGRDCEMPVIWTKRWGKGRVFYSALGHQSAEFESYPAVFDMTVRGLRWAAR